MPMGHMMLTAVLYLSTADAATAIANYSVSFNGQKFHCKSLNIFTVKLSLLIHGRSKGIYWFIATSQLASSYIE